MAPPGIIIKNPAPRGEALDKGFQGFQYGHLACGLMPGGLKPCCSGVNAGESIPGSRKRSQCTHPVVGVDNPNIF